MKSLVECIKANYPTKMSTKIEETLANIKEYFGEDIPMQLIEETSNGQFSDYILENLNTHDVDLLIKKLHEKFRSIEIQKAEEGSRLKKGGIIVRNVDFQDDDFYDLIEFYGYDVTAQDSKKAYVNPVKSDRADDYVYDKNHGQLYHFTTKKKIKSILDNGLRIKEGTYRYFPKRIYLYSSTKKLGELPNIADFMKKVTGEDDISNVCALKVNLWNHQIPMYHDETMEEGAVYCYNNIPSKFIKKIDINL